MPGLDHVSHAYMLGAPKDDLPDTVMLHEGDSSAELDALATLNAEQILVYPSELEGIDNPRGDDRAEYGKQVVR